MLEPGLFVGLGQRIEQGIKITVEDLVEIVCLEVDPVIGDPVLREVVRADPLAAVDGAERPTVAIRTGPAARRLFAGMHGAIAAMAAAGNNLIVDDVMLNDRIDEYRRLLSGFRLHVVGVFASLDVLEGRERQRGDRTIGLARWQFDRVHGGIDYHLRLDTDKATPQECACRIRDRFAL